MTEQELGIAKKIAEIEGFNASIIHKMGDPLLDFAVHIESPSDFREPKVWFKEYNPFCWSILGRLMVKYGVSLLKEGGYYKVVPEGMAFSIDCLPKNLEQAILECIIKSQEGL